jgi:hypothetical protein
MNINIGKHLRELYSYHDEPESLHELADTSWRLLLGALAVLVICVVAFAVWEFLGALAPVSSAPGAAVQTPPPILDKNQLQATLQELTNRQSNYDSLKSGSVPEADLIQ